MNDETAQILGMIDQGNAFSAEVENDLEDRGLIVQTDKPYATITAKGRNLLGKRNPTKGATR